MSCKLCTVAEDDLNAAVEYDVVLQLNVAADIVPTGSESCRVICYRLRRSGLDSAVLIDVFNPVEDVEHRCDRYVGGRHRKAVVLKKGSFILRVGVIQRRK